jgi:hypothetical protein
VKKERLHGYLVQNTANEAKVDSRASLATHHRIRKSLIGDQTPRRPSGATRSFGPSQRASPERP